MRLVTITITADLVGHSVDETIPLELREPATTLLGGKHLRYRAGEHGELELVRPGDVPAVKGVD